MNVAIPLPPQIDEGPPPVRSPSSMNNYMLPPTITKESDAKLCIDWMKSPDLSARVTAANRMAQVAQVLGPQRSRDVSVCVCVWGVLFCAIVFDNDRECGV